MKPILMTALAVLVLTGSSRGDDDRERRAKVALALAAKPVTVTAPAPRLVLSKDYPSATRESLASGKALVVFVDCKTDHLTPPGAVTAKVDALPDVTGPAAVVLYPVGGELRKHETLPCPVEAATLAASVRLATKKIDAPLASDAVAPKPLDWEISAPVCPACDCDTCPACKVPTKKKTVSVHVSPDGTVNELHADGIYRAVPGAPKQVPAVPSRVPAYLPTFQPTCPNGKCPNK